MARRKKPIIPDDVLDQVLAGRVVRTMSDADALLGDMKKALAERLLNAELDQHLDGEAVAGRPNCRNGYGQKTVLTDAGRVRLDIPRDRAGTFDPQLIARYRRRFPGFDDRIISMYARGMSVREIQGHLLEIYGMEASPDLISVITDAVLDEVAAWQNRPLEVVYPVVFFDALRVKIRDEGMVRNKAVHIALGIRADGTKEVLGLWIEQNEGARFWLRVMNELRHRGVEDILLAVVDGLKGFPDAIRAVFPEALVQTCIVHLLRHSLDFVAWKDRKSVATALKDIYRAVDAETGKTALAAFAESPWGRKYAAIVQSWEEVIPFYAFPADVRKLVYTTNAIEALNAKLRRAVRARGHFPNDDAALKLLFLALNRAEKEWIMPPREWSMAKAQFAILFGDRFARATV
ncbi:IS256 family transposase [Komagataeibacter sp. SM21]|uniref:IS256 family transposase n=1 Tax=Komagataeibacter sp. SM21 TaxID=3242899 RepID=UPI003526DBE3